MEYLRCSQFITSCRTMKRCSLRSFVVRLIVDERLRLSSSLASIIEYKRIRFAASAYKLILFAA
jgi:hypothetical protein